MLDSPSPLQPSAARADHVFPTLTAAQLARIAAHGKRRTVQAGEILIEAGDHVVPFFVVTAGALEVVRMSGESETLVALHGPGQFNGEVNMISGRRALFRLRARDTSEVVALDRDEMLSLFQNDAELSEILMRAFILRRVELVSNGVAMLNNGPDVPDADATDGGDIAGAQMEMMKDVRNAAGFYSHAGGAVPADSNGLSWNKDFITTTGNVVFDLLHNFHLECGARLHKLRVYETLSDPTGREVCGYLLVRGSVHAHAYALALKNLTGVEIEKMLPTPNIPLGNIPECQKYLDEGAHRRLYTFSPDDYKEMAGIWGNGEVALPDDPPGELMVVDGMPEGGKIQQLTGVPSAFTPDYAPEEMFEIATKLYKASR